jgi:pSer/pThr/pTyr-binding forkhead associated (FHA) protein
MSGVGTLTIGRRSDCEIVLRDKLVSRVHARIIVGAESAGIEDLGSSNGIFVNGQKIKGLHRLYAKDTIKIGEQVLEVLGFDDDISSYDEESTEMKRVSEMLPTYDHDDNVTTRVTEPPPKR